MRRLLTFFIAAIVLAALFTALRSVTGDAPSAAMIELLLLVTLGSSVSRLGGKSRSATRL